MKSWALLHAFALALIAVGCHHLDKLAQAPAPRASGNRVSFPPGAPQLTELRVQNVESASHASVQLFGRLAWNDNITVRVFSPFAGRVRGISAEVGETLHEGGTLAELESPDFAQAQSDAHRAESDLRLAESNLARLRDLYDHGAAARKDLEAAEADEARAQSEHARSLARVLPYGASTDSVNGRFALRSPLAGTVVEKNVEPGEEIRADQMLANAPALFAPLFVVSDPSRLWIQIDASEADLSCLRRGSEFTFTTRAFPGRTFKGRIDVISDGLDPNTRTIKVRGTVDNSEHLLKAEMFVTVNLRCDVTPEPAVPARAVFLKGDQHYVFVCDKPGEFARQQVTLGGEQDGEVKVLSGLKPGQRVVTDGCILLQQLLD
jgi:membrane fusion protein, heavy metal efflux system